MKISRIDCSNIENVKAIDNIFFETSAVKKFSSNLAKEKFKYKYLHYYLKNYPGYFFIAESEGEILGYICACPDTLLDSYFFETFPYYNELAKDILVDFPAHLHVNLSPVAQGKGVGSKLISTLIKELSSQSIEGIHIFTSKASKNVDFYRKNQFCTELSVRYLESQVYFMGKVINS